MITSPNNGQVDPGPILREEYAKLTGQLEAVEEQAKLRGVTLEVPDAKGDSRQLPARTASAILDQLIDRISNGEGDVLYPTTDVLTDFECGPGLLVVAGAPPGAGKTALAMQYTFGLLELDTSQRVVIANAEMSFDVLLRREVTRRSGVPARAIRFADLTPKQLDRVRKVADELRPMLQRVDVMPGPFTIDKVGEFCDEREPGLLVLDYLQKFATGDDPRTGTNAVMAELRYLSQQGWGVLALSATTRSPKGGHSPKQLSMASFKESGEIEFNSDVCYLLRDEGPVNGDERVRVMKLDCVKNRHDQQRSIILIFDKPKMTFVSPADAVAAFDDLPNDQPFKATEQLFEAAPDATEF